MFEALFSFLGGSVFRMVWGEIASFVQKKQDHTFELERMQAQAQAEDRAHQRNQEAMRLQAELGVKTLVARAEADVATEEAAAFTAAMRDAFKPTGNVVVDLWNGIIRPAAATIALGLWVLKLYTQSWAMQEWDITLAGTILGFFFASRELSKRGK